MIVSVCNSADVAQLVEHVLGKDEVSGSIPDIGSRFVQERSDWLQSAVPLGGSRKAFD